MDSDKELLSAAEAADFLGVKEKTLRARASEGKIPRVILWRGSRKEAVRFTTDSLRAHIKRNTIPARNGR